jgi:hypothetical protein
LHNETSHTLSWAKPTVNSDNCPPTNGAYPQAEEEARNGLAGNTFPQTTDQYDASDNVIGHTGQFPVGAYEIDYSLHDSNGNAYGHECKVEIEVEQYASPVHLECPGEVPASITGEKNYASVTWEEPNHNNGRAHQDNNPVAVSYSPAVVPGMAFPWGTTTITVIAEGSGNVSDAAHNRAECSFIVNVTDARPPTLHGKKYHCRKLPSGETAPGTAPYRICKATKHLAVQEHASYIDTGGYTITAVEEIEAQTCCDSEFANGTIISHYCAYESDLISYCSPGVP